MKIKSYILTLVIIISCSSCGMPSIDNFFYCSDTKSDCMINIVDKAMFYAALGHSSPSEEIDLTIFFDSYQVDYTIEDFSFYIIAKNKTDSIIINPIAYVSYGNLMKYSESNFKEFPISERIITIKISQNIKCEIPQIDFDKYDIYELYTDISINYKHEIIIKKTKQILIRRKKFYFKPVWL